MGTAPTVPTKAEGGTGFNPFQYGLGFSSFGLTNPAGSVPTPVAPAPTAVGPALGSAPVDPYAGQRGGVAIGQMMPNGKIRMPDDYYAGGGDADQDRALKKLGEADPKAWRSDFNYKNPNELYAQTMKKLTGDVGFIGKIFGATAIGRLASAGNLANLQSNIDYLKQRGGTAEQIAGLQKAHDDLTIKQLGSLEGGIITGWAQNQLSTESLLADNSESDMVGGGSSSSTTSNNRPTSFDPKKPDKVSTVDKAIRRNIAADLQTQNKRNNDASGKAADAAREARIKESKSSVDTSGSSSTTAGGVKVSGAKQKAGTGVGAGVGGRNLSGPMNKGGLMIKKK